MSAKWRTPSHSSGRPSRTTASPKSSAALAHLHFAYDWDWAGAQDEFGRALELSSRSSDVRLRYAIFLAAMGKDGPAIEQIRAAHDLDPVSHVANTVLAYVYLLVRRYDDDAIDQSQKTLAMYPDSVTDHRNLAICYEHKGMYSQALDENLKSDEFEGAAKEELEQAGKHS